MTEKNDSAHFGRMYQEITASSVENILRLHDDVGDCVFRGHADKEWTLCTTFERVAAEVPPEKLTKLERKVLLEFKRRVQHYLSDLPSKTDHLEWLALMQHHGCPTRLLDFTRSYFIALFFAVEDTNSDSSVWAVNRAFFECRPGIPASDDCFYSVYNHDAEEGVNLIMSAPEEQEQKSGVLLTEPFRMNERLSIQQGLFLFPTNLRVSFEENLCERFGAKSLDELSQREGTPVVVKIIIPKELHLGIVGILGEMNISAATLFPGLDGYARSQKVHIQSARLSIQEQQRLFKTVFDRLWTHLSRRGPNASDPKADGPVQ